ncbi:hypothetical protein GIB67_026692 [Kingdonia uniflora]|uniref:Uncharacterized protein n=1 Tax=Kingdonia uniflora TaxID=39325 RepID=A0A7J7L169_9MAGN|nr:hypothetical protein GIB67_026692 [Kingdonia uniflora]
MIVRNSEIEMLSRVDTMEIKAQIVRKLGHEKAEIYFYQLKRYLSGKLSKSREVFKFRDRKFRERPSPLGPHGKTFSSTICNESDPRALEQQSATELFSLGSRPPVEVTSVEDGEEVEQMKGNSPSIQSRSSVSAPLGISRGARRYWSRKKRKEIDISLDFLNVLNIGLDAYLKRLIKPCIELAGSRLALENIKQMYGQAWHERSRQMSNSSISVSMLDFRTAMESAQVSTSSTSASMLDFRGGMQLNPRLLGVDWPTELEKVVLRQSED